MYFERIFQVLGLCFIGFISAAENEKHISQDDLRFLVLGDWGGQAAAPYYTDIQQKVAHQMASVSENFGAQFVVSTGDNFYDEGVKNVHDPRFQQTFEEVYSSDSLQIPWYIIAGNHDYHDNGNQTAQLAYSRMSYRWNFPAFYYKKEFKIPGSQDSITMVFIDTVILCGNVLNDTENVQPLRPEDPVLAELQWAWIKQTLRSAKSSHIIVVGHYPVLSMGPHGSTTCLHKRLMPLLHRYKVLAYFSGHDHNLQHLTTHFEDWTVNYFVSGAGANVDLVEAKDFKIPEVGTIEYADTKYLQSGGFAYIITNLETMDLYFINGDGQKLYDVTLCLKQENSNDALMSDHKENLLKYLMNRE